MPYYLIFLGIWLPLLVQAQDTLLLQGQSLIDEDKKLILSNESIVNLNQNWPQLKTHVLMEQELYEFLLAPDSLILGQAYELRRLDNQQLYHLYFTELPIVVLYTSDSIVDEPNVLARFSLIETGQISIQSYVGIQYRGGWSQTLAKKSMEIEFWADSSGNQTLDFAPLGMIFDDDWNLQAMFNEPLRIRSKTNNDLWRMVNTLQHQQDEPRAINGIRMNYIEIFINGNYQGLYALGEKVKRKQLRLRQHNGQTRGELYKAQNRSATVAMRGPLPNYDNNSDYWEGFEFKYPNEVSPDWANLYEALSFVIDNSDSLLYADYGQYFEEENFIDYYLFINLLRATDNSDKNFYLAKYHRNRPYFFVPWDLDGSFGTMWRGDRDTFAVGLLSNGLYDKLWYDCRVDGFRAKLNQKWQSLRQTVLEQGNLLDLFEENYNYLQRNGIYEREAQAWPSYALNPDDWSYMVEWTGKRLAYLDEVFSAPCLSVSVSHLQGQAKGFELFPNPSLGQVILKANFEEKAQIRVYNALGTMVWQANYLYALGVLELDLSDFAAGLYWVEMRLANGKVYTEKLVLLQN